MAETRDQQEGRIRAQVQKALGSAHLPATVRLGLTDALGNPLSLVGRSPADLLDIERALGGRVT